MRHLTTILFFNFLIFTLYAQNGKPVQGSEKHLKNIRQLTFSGDNAEAYWSKDGKYLAYVSRISGAFKLQVMELATSTVTQLTDTSADESPSFAPNSRLIVYATQQQGREALMTTTLDGKIKARLAGASGDIREPDWGPYSR